MTTKSQWMGAAVLCAAMAVGFILRIYHYPQAFPNGEFSPFIDDPYYHMRRIHQAVRDYPYLPSFDPYCSFPKGDFSICKPLMHLAVATAAVAIGGRHPSKGLVDHLAAFFPPIVGTLTLIPVFLLTRRLFGRACACLSVTFIALIPANISVTMLGRVDHDCMEILFAVCLVWLIGCAVSVDRRRLLYAALAGVVFTLAFLTWYASVYFVLLLCGYLGVQSILDRMQNGNPNRVLGPMLVTLMTALATFLGVSLAFPSVVESRGAFLGIPFFEVAVVLTALGYWAVLWAASTLCARRNLSWLWLAIAALLIPFAGIAVLSLIVPAALSPLKRWVLMFAGRDPLSAMIADCEGMFYLGGRFRPVVAEVALTRSVYLFPFIYGLLVYDCARDKGRNPALVLFLVWTAAGAFLAFCMKRFDGQFSIWMCICLAAAVVRLRPHFRRLQARASANRTAKVAFRAAVLAMVFFLALPAIGYFLPISRKYTAVAEKFETIPPAYRKALEWLRLNSPLVSPDQKLEYAVLAEWHWGYWIEYLTGRPVVANANAMDARLVERFLDTARFLFAEDEKTADEVAAAYGCRYVITTLFPAHLKQYASMAGIDYGEYIDISSNGKMQAVYSLKRDYYLTMGCRLYDNDGSEFVIPNTSQVVPALRRYRLIYEGERDERVDPRVRFGGAAVKIFEFVKGARLVGATRPHAAVSIQVRVVTHQQRSFLYRTSGVANDLGEFEIVVPYPTTDSPYRTCAVLPYDVIAGDKTVQVDVSEVAVREGEAVRVHMARE